MAVYPSKNRDVLRDREGGLNKSQWKKLIVSGKFALTNKIHFISAQLNAVSYYSCNVIM